MNSYGSIRQLENGQWQQQPDYVKALELFRRLTQEFAKGETRYYDQALQQIKTITEPSIGVGVGNIFLPDSEIQFGLYTRNVRQVDFALYKFDMTRDVHVATTDSAEGEGDLEHGFRKFQPRVAHPSRRGPKRSTAQSTNHTTNKSG